MGVHATGQGLHPKCDISGVSALIYFISVMDSRQSYEFPESSSSTAAHVKRWSWLAKIMNKNDKDSIYNTRVISQEYDPQPNWTLPEIKIYNLPMFKFCTASLFRFASVNVPISLNQQVYQVPLINKEYVE